MTHLLSDGSPNGVHIAIHRHEKFHTVLRLPPREQRIHRRQRPQAVPIARYRRAWTWRELAVELIFVVVLPASVLLFVAFCVVAFVWLGWAIDRAIKSLNGGL